MALDDTATLVIGAGNFFTAAVGTDLPADLTAPGVAWTNIGHTSLEDIFGATSEGGEKTILATLQNAALRSKRTKRTETFTFTIQQFDEASLKLYYGGNSTIGAGGEVCVADDPTPTEAAFLVVFTDGATEFAYHCHKSEIYRNDDPSFADTESLAGLPLGVTPMKNSTDPLFSVTPIGV